MPPTPGCPHPLVPPTPWRSPLLSPPPSLAAPSPYPPPHPTRRCHVPVGCPRPFVLYNGCGGWHHPRAGHGATLRPAPEAAFGRGPALGCPVPAAEGARGQRGPAGAGGEGSGAVAAGQRAAGAVLPAALDPGGRDPALPPRHGFRLWPHSPRPSRRTPSPQRPPACSRLPRSCAVSCAGCWWNGEKAGRKSWSATCPAPGSGMGTWSC